ncbi:LysR family transcriptional regulator [Limoniibacter endophyticus]|uniref:LysR family transcriptional regulator n=1 Tax=Limoniibacter endophyticus TaxID=1565040 RepID=A0A8J3DJ14_9HYPH|nr:LysR family transcriptional regulator [Limoniibacter endophyticus]GHC72185.1 LysR family transcriptional regulator [Limoniibacter endophyticus]
MALEIRQLRHFSAVAHLASFSAAAKELNLTQPALSKSVRMLEESIGVTLFERGPSGVTLTIFGERLKNYADLMLTLSSEAIDEIDALRGVRRGSLRIGCVAAVLRAVMPNAVTSFLERHPGVDIVVSEGLNDTLLDLLHGGRLDLAVTLRPSGALNPDLEYVNLLEEPLLLVCGQNHPLAGETRVSLSHLVPYGWVVPPRPDPDRLRLDALFVNGGLPKPRMAVETTSVVFQSAMLNATDNLSYLTQSSLHAQKHAGAELSALPLDVPTWMRTTCATYRRQSVARPTVNAFLRHCAEICAKMTA